MKIVYSLPHPADQLESSQAGHTVRARAILSALERRGHEIIRVQAAAGQQSQAAVSTYRSIVKKLLPRPIAMRLRDTARVAYSRRYAGRLIEALQQHRPDVILETHIAFTLAGKIASAETGIPLVLDDVAPPWEEEEQYGVGSRKLARQTYQEITHQARMLVAVSGAIRRLLIAEGLSLIHISEPT
ncbi:MAG: glycosyltransferase, partial [Chloroflexi bacterium]|nr:glycosyltransferase [Chloroflexota bacterium]